MYRGRSKLLPIVLLVLVAVVAIVALVSIGRLLLSGNTNTATEVAEDPAKRALLTTEVDRSVRMTVRGPIVADEDFRSYQVEVSPIGRRMTTYKGYLGTVIDDTRLGNNSKAYTEFVNALDLVNFTKPTKSTVGINDVAGVCASGRLYTFELLQAQSVVKEYWTASCRDAAGTFGGNAVSARSLIENQIPTSRDLLRSLNI